MRTSNDRSSVSTGLFARGGRVARAMGALRNVVSSGARGAPVGADVATSWAADVFEAGTPPDARLVAARALDDIRRRVRAGERVRVVFDIDDTVVDTSRRTVAAAREFDRLNGTRHFAALRPEDVRYDLRAMGRALGIPERVIESFEAHWRNAFFDGRNYVHDRPIDDIVSLARQAAAAGAEVVYLTGRWESEEPHTVAQLQRHGLPNADADHVHSKPSSKTDTAGFKADTLEQWRNEGIGLGFFVTESRRDTQRLQERDPEGLYLLLESLRVDEGSPRPDTPLWR